jgi:hypothetical protein
MKTRLFLLIICCSTFSCENRVDFDIKADSLIGFWSRETVYLNGVNSAEYVDFLNDGNGFLEIKEDQGFSRPYDLGVWHLSGRILTLDRDESTGMGDWSYKILEVSPKKFVLEISLTEGQYCCGFDAFTSDEVIVIKEVYSKLN